MMTQFDRHSGGLHWPLVVCLPSFSLAMGLPHLTPTDLETVNKDGLWSYSVPSAASQGTRAEAGA